MLSEALHRHHASHSQEPLTGSKSILPVIWKACSFRKAVLDPFLNVKRLSGFSITHLRQHPKVSAQRHGSEGKWFLYIYVRSSRVLLLGDPLDPLTSWLKLNKLGSEDKTMGVEGHWSEVSKVGHVPQCLPSLPTVYFPTLTVLISLFHLTLSSFTYQQIPHALPCSHQREAQQMFSEWMNEWIKHVGLSSSPKDMAI